MINEKTMAYINMYAVLGALENLCKLDSKANSIVSGIKSPVSIGFVVKDGPAAVFKFSKEGCVMTKGEGECDIKIPFSSCGKFNGMVDGTVTPVPTKGFSKIGFLLKTFIALTDRLGEVMRPSEAAMADPAFFEMNTELTFFVVACAISQIGNYDPIGTFSAQSIENGDIMMSIKDGPKATIRVKSHVLDTIKETPASPRCVMEFGGMKLANDLFNDKVNSLACIGNGSITMKGMISMLDNMNRILDRVAVYLA